MLCRSDGMVGCFDGVVGCFDGVVGCFDVMVGCFDVVWVGCFDGVVGCFDCFDGMVGCFDGMVGCFDDVECESQRSWVQVPSESCGIFSPERCRPLHGQSQERYGPSGMAGDDTAELHTLH